MRRYDAVGKVEEVKDDPVRSKNEGANGDPQDELPPKKQKGYDPFRFLGGNEAARLELESVKRPEQKRKERGRRRRASKAARKARKRNER